MSDTGLTDGAGPRYFGVYPAIVTNIHDDANKLSRIEVKFPWLGAAGEDVRALATMVTPYADDDQGFEMLPAKDSQVLVAFEAGDLRRPYILGACWNGQESLPHPPEASNDKKLLKTRAGSLLEFDDKDGTAKVTLSTKNGNKLVLEEAGPTVTLEQSGGSKVVLEASGSVTITATSTMTINASSLTVNAASTTFSGSVTCTTFTCTSCTSPLYSQGAGNIW